MKKGDLAAGSVLLCFSAFLLYQSIQMPTVSGLILGPGSLPFGLGCCLAMLSLVLIYQELRRGNDGSRNIWPKGKELKRALSLVLLFGVYTAAADNIGFTLSTLAFLIIAMRMVKAFSWKFILASSFLATACIYVIFNFALGIPLPGGLLGI